MWGGTSGLGGIAVGLESTIYIAAKTPPKGALLLEPLDNVFALDPPEGMQWWMMFDWRKHYVLDANLGMGMGSPDWRILHKKSGLGYLAAFQHQVLMHWQGESMLAVEKYRMQDIKFLVWAREKLIQGHTLMYERVS